MLNSSQVINIGKGSKRNKIWHKGKTIVFHYNDVDELTILFQDYMNQNK